MAKRRKKLAKLLSLRQRLQLESMVLAVAVLCFAGLIYQNASAFGMVMPIASTPTPAAPTPLVETPQPTPAPTPKPSPKPVPTPVVKKVTSGNSSRRTVAVKPATIVVTVPGSSVVGLTPTGSSGSGGGPNPSPSPSSTPPGTTGGYVSSNWSGYLETGSIYTDISGSWTATKPTGFSGINSADATWIGIGGVTASDLIQVGTQNIVSPSGQVNTTAFYELLPGTEVDITSLPVTAGDDMSAQIMQTSTGQWTITITDNTTGGTYTQNVAYSSSLSSAEWVEEDPSTSRLRLIPFDFFGLASFSGADATSNGASVDLSGGDAVPITMVNSSGSTVALPSSISFDGLSFSVSP